MKVSNQKEYNKFLQERGNIFRYIDEAIENWYDSNPNDTATNTEWQLPEAVLIQFVSPGDEHDMLETCREL